MSAAPASTDDARRALAREPALVRALTARDREAAMGRLRQVVLEHSGIYNLSWMDSGAVSRFGYPPENSFRDVPLRSESDPEAKACTAAIDGRKEMTYEGDQARFFITPVLDGQEFLGDLLWIRCK